MISVVVAEPIDVIDAGEMADFGGGQTAHGCRCSAARAHRLTSVTSGLAIRKADVFSAERRNRTKSLYCMYRVESTLPHAEIEGRT